MKTKNQIKEIRNKIAEMTILLETAREEGDEEHHKEVVDEIMFLFKKQIKELQEELKEELKWDVDFIDKIFKKRFGDLK